MVNLRDFVRGAIVEIVNAVREAQEETRSVGAHVNPAGLSGDTTNRHYVYDATTKRGLHVAAIEFDVAVTAAEGSGSGAKIGVLGGVFGLGAQGSYSESESAISRIKFSVPVALPPAARFSATEDDGMGGQRIVPPDQGASRA